MRLRNMYYRNLMPYPIYLPNPYLYSSNLSNQVNINETNQVNKNEERFIPFVGGALIGGALGSAYSRPRYYGYPMYGGYYPYYQNPGYYSVSSYNYGGYPVYQTPYNNQ